MKPGYKQTEVGVIPVEWETASLTELVVYGPKNGYSGKSGKKSQGTPTLSLGATSSGCLVLSAETVKRLDETIHPRSDLYLKPGDVLVQRSNTPDLVGTTAVFNGPPDTYVYPDLMMRMRFCHDATAHWFWRYANSNSGRRFFVSVAAGSSGSMPKISGEKLRAMQLPLPPLSEQRAIATALSDVDGLLGALDRLIAKKRDLKQAAMQQLLTGQTRLPGFKGEWVVKRIGDFTDCTAGGTPSTLVSSYWGGSIRWMSSGELNLKRVEEVSGRITDSGLQNSSTKIIPAKCVLIGLAGQGKTRGTIAMNYVELCTNQSIAAVFPNPSFVPEYLYFNLDSRYDELRELSAGDGGRGGLNLRIIKAILIPFPPIPEQTAIATLLSEMDAELAALEQRRDKTRALKQGMMQELLTGRTRLL
ncbi:MAG: hypothetical protein RLZZ245_2849 [Verrucomicrobiota bacterium]|jgi:type I restriction enzyme S subunit